MNPRVALLAGGLLGGTGVAAGAFGAHALRPLLLERGMLEAWQTAAHYQLFHAAVLIGLAGWLRGGHGAKVLARTSIAAWCWVVGTVFFSGSLYLLSTGAPRWVGPITPLGGAAYLVGWMFIILAAFASE